MADREYLSPDGMRVTLRRVSAFDEHGHKQKRWCVQWQTALMSAPAFWYYPTADIAEEQALALLRDHSPQAVQAR